MKSIVDIIKIISDNSKVIMLVIIAVLIMLFLRQCESTQKAKDEVTRITNNNTALTDTLEHYIDENGLLNGEIRGLNLTIDELGDEVEFEKNKPPITIVKYKTEIRDSIVFTPVIEQVFDTLFIAENPDGQQHVVKYNDTTTFGQSYRIVDFNMPIFVHDSLLYGGKANLTLRQNIWLESTLLQDRKTKEVFINLKTDYPGVSFNNASGILVQDDEGLKKFQRNSRKTIGLGIQMGVGMTTTGQFRNYVGVGIQYTPKFLQW